MTDVTVVVPARNASATIGDTLAALAAQETQLNYEVIVVDSGSTDGTPAIAGGSPVVADVLHNPGGEPAGSRNLGVARGHGPLLAFTDADCAPAPNWLAVGAAALGRADIVQGAVRPRRSPGSFDRTVSVTSEYGLYETANLFVRRRAFEAVGGFAPVFAGERPFAEDAWFVWRARRAGATTTFAADAVVHHEVFPRGPAGFVAERARCRHFPPLVGLIPELREQFLHRRWFLSPASLRFDLALASLALARPTGHAWLGWLGVANYAAPLARELTSLPAGERLRVPGARLAADAVTFAALVLGGVRARTLVL